MAQLALYRKYRSQTFEDLIGQDHIVRTLQTALATGRIAQTFLFTGPRGTGKTSTARLLAKALNGERNEDGTLNPDGENCKLITAGNHPDVIEMDAASEAGVDDVREKIIDVASYAPMLAPYKVFIIDEVHDLSPKAFDALLKTIEEPPQHLVFILATTEFSKVPATIRSRCQKYEFHRASIKNLVDRLNYVCEQEGVKADPAAISAIARMADGGYRDALTLLEQAILVADGHLTVDVVYDQLGMVSEQAIDQILIAIQSGDVPTLLDQLEIVIRSGRDPRGLLESMLYRLADLTRVIYQVKDDAIDATRESSMHELSTRLGRPFLVGVRSAIAEAHKVIRDITLPKLWLESELVKLATIGVQSAQPAAVKVAEVPPPSPRAVIEEPEKPVERKVFAPTKEEAPVEPTPVSDTRNDWERLIASLPLNPKTGQPSPHQMKLKGTTLLEDSGDKLKVAFESQMNHDWFLEQPQRMKFVVDALANVGRAGTELEFIVEKKNDLKAFETEAVELPVDGARLERIVRDVFNVPETPEQ